MKFREMYNRLKESGDLYKVFEDMTGDWKEDKLSFIQQQEALESLGNTIEVYE